MAAPSEKLAESLDVLKALQKEGAIAIRSAELTRVHRERLLKGRFLQEVMKGWYIPVRPDEPAGESMAWYACFWDSISVRVLVTPGACLPIRRQLLWPGCFGVVRVVFQ